MGSDTVEAEIAEPVHAEPVCSEPEHAELEHAEPECVFGAPWEAQVFALVLTLQHRGLFTWAEWSEALTTVTSPETETPDMSDSHYAHWLAALEILVVRKGVGDAEELSTLYQSWDKAARATPHGQPIELGN